MLVVVARFPGVDEFVRLGEGAGESGAVIQSVDEEGAAEISDIRIGAAAERAAVRARR